MILESRNPLKIKFFTSLDGYAHLFLSPILIFLLTRNVQLSGLFFLIEGIVRFFSYSFAGSYTKKANVNKLIKLSYLARFLIVTLHLIIFYFIDDSNYWLMLINNIFFIIANSLFVTSIETTLMNHVKYSAHTQSIIAMGDLLSAGACLSFILLILIFKLPFWLIWIPLFVCFCYGMKTINRLYVINRNFQKVIDPLKLLSDLKDTIKTIFKNKALLVNICMGYLPLTILIVTEQKNIYQISSLFDKDKMQIFHFVYKAIAFISAGIIVPFFIKKFQKNEIPYYSFIMTGISVIATVNSNNMLVRFIAVVLLSYAHFMLINYRKIKRRDIMIKNNISQSSLGLFFAFEGLSNVFSNAYLSVFKLNQSAYILFSLTILIIYMYLIKMENKHEKENSSIENS